MRNLKIFAWKPSGSLGLLVISCLFSLLLVVQSPSRVQLFETPWTAACQASLSLTISQSLPKFMSIASVMPSNHLILCHPLLLCLLDTLQIKAVLSSTTTQCQWIGFAACQASEVAFLHTRRGLTLLSQLFRVPAIGVRNGEEPWGSCLN